MPFLETKPPFLLTFVAVMCKPGAIARQEAVSMVPPLLLNVKSAICLRACYTKPGTDEALWY
eukprot:3941214-Rhodomonas_salina.6